MRMISIKLNEIQEDFQIFPHITPVWKNVNLYDVLNVCTLLKINNLLWFETDGRVRIAHAHLFKTTTSCLFSLMYTH